MGETHVFKLPNFPFWGNLSEFVLSSSSCRSLNDLVSFLWSNKILNFFILRDCHASIAEVYSYFPFANGSCREFRETNIKKLGTFRFNATGIENNRRLKSGKLLQRLIFQMKLTFTRNTI